MSCQSREAKHTRSRYALLRSPSRPGAGRRRGFRSTDRRAAELRPEAGMIETRRRLLSLLSARVARRLLCR